MPDRRRKTWPRRCGVLVGLLTMAACAALAQSPPADPAAERTARWREDLRFLSAAMSA